MLMALCVLEMICHSILYLLHYIVVSIPVFIPLLESVIQENKD